MTEPKRYLFFYGPKQSHGCFSQWYLSDFTIPSSSLQYLHRSLKQNDFCPETLTFNCCEQYMMYCKAFYFCDKATARAIMATNDPKEQKALGRKVNGFWDGDWNEVREKVVEEGNIAKFMQNGMLKVILLETGSKHLVEASKTDSIWGIGFYEDTALTNESNWGLNLLGKGLDRVRERIRALESDA